MSAPLIRASTPADLSALQALERRHFASLRRTSGYLFGTVPGKHASLDPAAPGPRRCFVAVAEVDGTIEGFALAMAFSMPGNGAVDPSNMLLQYLAVNEPHRRLGIGRQLLEHLEERIAATRQNVMVAHVPSAEAEFYRRVGWEVMAPTGGFAWLAFNDLLRADYPNLGIGYDQIAAKVLRPRALRRWYGFPRASNAPIADALIVLEALIERGDLDVADLDEGTTQMIGIARAARAGNL